MNLKEYEYYVNDDVLYQSGDKNKVLRSVNISWCPEYSDVRARVCICMCL